MRLWFLVFRKLITDVQQGIEGAHRIVYIYISMKLHTLWLIFLHCCFSFKYYVVLLPLRQATCPRSFVSLFFKTSRCVKRHIACVPEARHALENPHTQSSIRFCCHARGDLYRIPSSDGGWLEWHVVGAATAGLVQRMRGSSSPVWLRWLALTACSWSSHHGIRLASEG